MNMGHSYHSPKSLKLAKPKGAESKLARAFQVSNPILISIIAKTQKEADMKVKQGSNFKHGRWSKEEHLRFL